MTHLYAVVPARDEATRLASLVDQLLRSDLGQATTWAEVVISDDASQDGTAELCALLRSVDGRVTRIGNAGPAAGKVRAVMAGDQYVRTRAAGGDLVLVVDADAVVTAGALKRLVEACSRRPELAAVSGASVPLTRSLGRWGSSFQMDACRRAVRVAHGTAIHIDDRLFCYRLGAVADSVWEAGRGMSCDMLLREYLDAAGLATEWFRDAEALALPPRGYLAFHMQTSRNRSIAGRAWSAREGAWAYRLAGLLEASRHPLRAAAYAMAVAVSHGLSLFVKVRYEDTWRTLESTKHDGR